jgi:hypothetical protein
VGGVVSSAVTEAGGVAPASFSSVVIVHQSISVWRLMPTLPSGV